MTDSTRSLGGRMLRWSIALVVLGIVVVPAVLLAGWLIWPRQVEPQAPFTQRPLDLRVYDIYDVGIVDADGNGTLDIITANHDARQSLLLGDGTGGFVDGLSALGLDQEPDFPGLEDRRRDPPMARPGLYVFFRDRALWLVHRGAGGGTGGDAVSGSIAASLPVEISPEDGFSATAETTTSERGAVRSRVTFDSGASGRLKVQYPSNAVPISITLDPGTPLEDVHVGALGVSPNTRRFELALRDRHGIAWNDLTDNGRLDVFVSRGGLFGWMDRMPETFTDELLIQNGAVGFTRQALERGLEKRGCSGRQVAWIDYDNDGLLDLYIACGRGSGGFWDYVPRQLRPLLGGGNFRDANQLWRQQADGRFVEVAGELGLDFAAEGTFLWLDVENDGRMDLLWASENGVFLHRNDGGGFTGEEVEPKPLTPIRKLLVADIDRDGDLDVYAAAAIGSRLLRNDGGRLISTDPAERGLPTTVRTASWVDYDNDGLIDMHAWPDGLFRQTASGQFVNTELAGMPSPYWWLVDPRVAWFDMDNDGRRDLLVAQRWFPFAMQDAQPELFPFWSALFANGIEDSGHWLQVELIGASGNRPAIGAQVVLESTHGQEVQQVGQSDSSHYGQGHYRLYFGLGADAQPRRLTVRWPDGHVTTLNDPAIDRLLRLERHPEDNYLERRAGTIAMLPGDLRPLASRRAAPSGAERR